jgi:hypothetical protein
LAIETTGEQAAARNTSGDPANVTGAAIGVKEGVQRCNLAIAQIPDIDISEAEITELVCNIRLQWGQARALGQGWRRNEYALRHGGHGQKAYGESQRKRFGHCSTSSQET